MDVGTFELGRYSRFQPPNLLTLRLKQKSFFEIHGYLFAIGVSMKGINSFQLKMSTHFAFIAIYVPDTVLGSRSIKLLDLLIEE